MRTSICTKGLVLVIICLFVGTCILPTAVRANSPPNAEIVSVDPDPAFVGEIVHFVGKASDPDDYTKYFSWDFNGDGTYEIVNDPVNGTGEVYHYANYTYSSYGPYNILLKVTDDENGLDFDYIEDFIVVDITIDIENTYANVPTNFTIDVVGFLDTLTYFWAYGDGTTNETTSHQTEHVYNALGVYNGWVNVTSQDEGTVRYNFSVTITPPVSDPAQPTGPVIGKTNTEYTFMTNATSFTGDQIYYLWDWGDGTNSSWLGPYPSGEMVNASHQWLMDGDTEIKVKSGTTIFENNGWSEVCEFTVVQLKKAIYLGTFTGLNQTEDLLILDSKFFIIIPSDPMLVTDKKVVIATDNLMGLGRTFTFGMGGIAVL
jgi:hypothetical protein